MIRYKRAASNESEETNIGAASQDGSNKLEDGGERRPVAGVGGLAQVESGHHDPKQRRIYLILIAFSCLSAFTGMVLLLTWMFNYRSTAGIGVSDAGKLSNLHTVLMYTFMVSLNMYSVLIYRTHFDLPKERLKWAHAILSGTNIVMSLLGVLAMYKAHLMAGIPNFYSLHSWIGVLTNGFYLSQFVLGFVAFLKPGLAAHRRSVLMPWHRLIGAMILVLAALAAITGTAELVIFQDNEGLYSKFTPITFIANILGLSIILTTAISIYLLTAPQYLRPTPPEEEPLKR